MFGKSLKESLHYASVQISTADANGDLYVWGYIPVVVAKWYVCLVFSFVLANPPKAVCISKSTVRIFPLIYFFCSLSVQPPKFRARFGSMARTSACAISRPPLKPLLG